MYSVVWVEFKGVLTTPGKLVFYYISVLFSPGQGVLEARELAEWILADQLPVRFQVQLHKYLWGEEPGH